MVNTAIIKIWNQEVGTVYWNEQQQLASFEYFSTFLSKKWDLSPIKMPLQNGSQIYQFPALRKQRNQADDTFKGLPGLLSDVLPDKYGNQLIDIWLAQQGRPSGSMNPVEQLCFIGKRGMGALEFEPAHFAKKSKSFEIEVNHLVDIAQRMLYQRQDFLTNLKKNDQQAVEQILKIGTSAGGARPKAVIAYNTQTGEVKSGQTDAPKGFEHWLLKLDGVSDAQFGESKGWGRIEYAYYLMAIACGVEMMPSILLEENQRAHFMTKRFDRENSETKHHIQTLCGLQHFDYNLMQSYSYEQVFQTMRLLRLSYAEAKQMFKRMVFNVIASNCDDHTKNFSFLLEKDKQWRLAPAYDICYAYDPTNFWVNQQTLSVNGKRKNITKQDMLTIAKSNNIKDAEKIIQEINYTIKQWQDFAQQAKVNEIKQKLIQKHLKIIK